MMHGVRGFFRFAHIDGLIGADPAVYARLPRIHSDESRTQGLDRLELIRFLQVAQTLTVHHGALAYLLGINALRLRSRGRPNRGLQETLRGHRVVHLVGKGTKPATMPITRPGAPRPGSLPRRTNRGPLVLRPVLGKPIDRRDVYRMILRVAKIAGMPRHVSPHSLRHVAITNALDAGVPLRDARPGPARRPPHHRALRPCARRPRPPRRPLPHRLRRRRLTCVHPAEKDAQCERGIPGPRLVRPWQLRRPQVPGLGIGTRA
jgi:integrase/recombinase XerD